MYEYVVWDNIDNCVHRGPESEAWCLAWVEETRAIFGPEAEIDKVWSVRRRPVGEWETYNVPS